MKKFSFLMLAAAGLLFNACSDETVAEGSGGQGDSRSEGYVALNINLPTTPSTRAVNDDFDDGDAKEYNVEDCALFLFEKTGTSGNESDYVLFSSKDIQLPLLKDDVDGDNVTTTYQTVTTVSGRTTTSGDIYALALLNYKNVLSFDENSKPTFKNLKQALSDGGITLATIRDLITTSNAATLNAAPSGVNGYFFMTNAVLSSAKGGAVSDAPQKTDIFQLATLDGNKIYDTEDKAKMNPAGEIFVERAVAKATLAVTGQGTFNYVDASVATTLNFSTENATITWALDNIEPTTYIFRNPGTLDYIGYKSDGLPNANYRFVGSVPTSDNTALVTNSYYRTYWCVDPQYNDDNMTVTRQEDNLVEKNSTGMIRATNANFTAVGTSTQSVGTPQYCVENTFDVKHQSYRNTTRAIIKVAPNNVSTFWTVNGGSDIYTTEENATAFIESYIINLTKVEEVFQKNLKEATAGEEVKHAITAADFDITYNRNTTTGQLEVTAVALATNVENGNDFKANNTLRNDISALFNVEENKYNDNEIIKAINDNVVVFEYTDGVMYYEARFMHFASTTSSQDLAPWNTWEKDKDEVTNPATGTTAKAYPDYSGNNYLGRYGMVRNNWYDVEVTAFKNVGYPEIPSVTVKNPGYDDPDTPDDKLKDNIAVKVHVLSWAKRTQGWSF